MGKAVAQLGGAILHQAGIEAYFLKDLDEHVIPRIWNVNNLKMY